MAINFKNILPLWKNKGEEPPESLKENGFQPGYQPPAKVFNWFWHLVSSAVGELQGKVSEVDDKADGIGLLYDPECHAIELGEGGHSGGSGGGSTYTPTAAGPDKLGCIKVGSDFDISEDGTLTIKRADDTDIREAFEPESASASRTEDAIDPVGIAKVSRPTTVAKITATAAPENTGDTARYIRDGSGVYHPVEDTAARKAAQANAVALTEKVDKEPDKGLSTNDYTDEEKEKLEGIAAGATRVIVDKDLDDSSSNPVANYVIDAALLLKADKEHSHNTDDITDLAGKLAGKADTGHKHSTDDITGLNETLDGKAEKEHDHNNATDNEAGFMSAEDKTWINNFPLESGEGKNTLIQKNTIGSESNTASGRNAIATGSSTTASGGYSHAEGDSTTASGIYSHAEGRGTTASNEYSHSEGWNSKALGSYSHAEGDSTTASGYSSHAEGDSTTASGSSSHAEGYQTTAKGSAAHAEGYLTTADSYQLAIGLLNIEIPYTSSASDSLFIVGNGLYDEARSNALRVTKDGNCYAQNTFNGGGADYAEYFEWLDENPDDEDRTGLFVTLEGNKIRIANADDTYILGVISATPLIVGNAQSETWRSMYLTDVFGKPLTETVEIEESTDEAGHVTPAHTEVRYVVNPDYNPDEKYISREKRKEWAAVGFMGQLVVIDDGSCEANGYCRICDGGTVTAVVSGISAASYRVLERLDETHIRILIK